MPGAQVAPRIEVGWRYARESGAWLLLCAVALLVRCLRHGVVLRPSGVPFPNAADDFYHLRRIWFSVSNFPASLDFDLYVNHPVGAAPVWPPTFDWLLAAVARALVGAGDQSAVEGVVVWAAPVLGALSVLAVAWLARRTFSRAAGWVAGGLLALLPAHVEASELGVFDHHVAVGLAATFLLAAAMRFATAGELERRAWARSLAVGTAFAGTLLLWPGALLQVLAIQLFLTAQLVATPERSAAELRARSLAGVHAVAAGLLLPFCLGNDWPDFGPLSPWVLSNFQPLWFSSAGVAFVVAWALWSRTSLGETTARRAGAAVTLGAVGVGAAWVVVPGLAGAVQKAATFFQPAPVLDVIAELSPLLYPDGALDFSLANHEFSYLFWVYPLAAISLSRDAILRRRADVLLLVFVSLVFAGLTLHQQRFTDFSAAGFALVVGPACVEALRTLRERARAPALVWVAVAGLAAIAALLPYAPQYARTFRQDRAVLQGARPPLPMSTRQAILTQRMARWLREETPPTRGYLQWGEPPEYGVLAPWGHGHRIRYYAERPMVQDNFGPWGGAGFRAAGEYYDSRTERRATAIAEQLRARYVLVTPFGSGQHLPLPGSIAERLSLVPGKGRSLSFREGAKAPNRHRLVYATDDRDLPRPPHERILSAAIYEIVDGALITGCARPTHSVRLELEVPLPGRPPIPYRASTRADLRGRYRIRVPYPSEGGYRVRAGPVERLVAVGEADVREGRTVEGPCFQ